jgi:hypothetical protein
MNRNSSAREIYFEVTKYLIATYLKGIGSIGEKIEHAST